MAIYERSGPWGNLRIRTFAKDPALAASEASEQLRNDLAATAEQARNRIATTIRRGYPTLHGWDSYRRLTRSGIFVGLTISDEHFEFQEYDTEPHWPPFGKCTVLYAWATARNIDPFALAWSMAPKEPTDVVLPYCSEARGKTEVTMAMHGSGGRPSKRYDGRLVATRGKYLITDLFSEIGQAFDLSIQEAAGQAIDRFASDL